MADNTVFIAAFKPYALQGNVMDFTVCTIICCAFFGITLSLVSANIMPLIRLLVTVNPLADQVPPAGSLALIFIVFILSVFIFFALALMFFALAKGINTFSRKDNMTPLPSKSIFLLPQARDLLVKR